MAAVSVSTFPPRFDLRISDDDRLAFRQKMIQTLATTQGRLDMDGWITVKKKTDDAIDCYSNAHLDEFIYCARYIDLYSGFLLPAQTSYGLKHAVETFLRGCPTGRRHESHMQRLHADECKNPFMHIANGICILALICQQRVFVSDLVAANHKSVDLSETTVHMHQPAYGCSVLFPIMSETTFRVWQSLRASVTVYLQRQVESFTNDPRLSLYKFNTPKFLVDVEGCYSESDTNNEEDTRLLPFGSDYECHLCFIASHLHCDDDDADPLVRQLVHAKFCYDDLLGLDVSELIKDYQCSTCKLCHKPLVWLGSRLSMESRAILERMLIDLRIPVSEQQVQPILQQFITQADPALIVLQYMFTEWYGVSWFKFRSLMVDDEDDSEEDEQQQ